MKKITRRFFQNPPAPAKNKLLPLGALLALALAWSNAHHRAEAGHRTADPNAHHPVTDFSKPEPGEDRPGGAATSRKTALDRNAFSHASGNMSFQRELDFKVGNGVFRKKWVSAPASTKSSDGLGPLYNARSCQLCHIKDGRGHPPEANWPDDNAVSMFLRLSVPPRTEAEIADLKSRRRNVIPEPTYGGQLQDLAVQGLDAEGKMHIEYRTETVTLAGGETVALRRPQYSITGLAYGPLDPEIMISPRVAPQMIGLGLLEAVPEADILNNADPGDKDGDGISGRPNRVWSLARNKPVLGRFGWKAGNPTVKQQSAGAFAGDIGISNPLAHSSSGDCTVRQARCLQAPHGGSGKDGNLELNEKLLDLVAFYSRNLAVPQRRNAANAEILRGKENFHAIGCAACHRPKFRTGNDTQDVHLRNQLIWPYTDLLLHDMGEGLADHRPEGAANGREWRTAPLWGIGLTPQVNGHSFYLHDGRARSIKEAILWHGGEAKSARDAFAKMLKEDRERLIAFIKSL